MRGIVLIAVVLAFVGCTAAQKQDVSTGLTAVSASITEVDAEITKAKTIWGIAKGIAMVAEIASPASAPAINAFIAVGDAKVAQIDQMRHIAVPDAQAIIAVAKGVQDNAVSLQNGTASVVTVTPNKAS